MQKQITAKRGQIDALQSKIQFLEEAMTNANKVGHCPQNGETNMFTHGQTTRQNKMKQRCKVQGEEESLFLGERTRGKFLEKHLSRMLKDSYYFKHGGGTPKMAE